MCQNQKIPDPQYSNILLVKDSNNDADFERFKHRRVHKGNERSHETSRRRKIFLKRKKGEKNNPQKRQYPQKQINERRKKEKKKKGKKQTQVPKSSSLGVVWLKRSDWAKMPKRKPKLALMFEKFSQRSGSIYSSRPNGVPEWGGRWRWRR